MQNVSIRLRFFVDSAIVSWRLTVNVDVLFTFDLRACDDLVARALDLADRTEFDRDAAE